MIHLHIADPFVDKVNPAHLEQAALSTLTQQGVPAEPDLTIVIDDDTQLHRLNLEFLGIDAPTDVLSFPSGEEQDDPETGRRYLGDIIISFPRAEAQALAGGHTVLAELQLLVVHGTLHLLGHDHAEPDEKELMWTAQREILTGLGAQISHLPD